MSLNIQLQNKGFGSYLKGILPDDIATAAGAFAASMQQVKNIQSLPVEKLAQIVANLETTKDLEINGSTIPADLFLARTGLPIIAKGDGPYGTYTMSNFLGTMSGLPYTRNNIKIFDIISAIQTRKLSNIYRENYLAVTWDKASMTISQPYSYTITKPYKAPTPGPNTPNPNYQPDPLQPNYDPAEYLYPPTNSPIIWVDQGWAEEYDWHYTITFSLAQEGEGYGRGSAPPPVVAISPNNVGASAVSSIGTNDENVPGNFGKVTNVQTNFGGRYTWTHTVQDNWTTNIYPNTTPPFYPPKSDAWVRANMPEEVISIEAPPTELLPVQDNGDVATDGANTPGIAVSYKRTVSTGTTGWPLMDSRVQQYIDQANAEILVIQAANQSKSSELNNHWNDNGKRLAYEQRARTIGLPALPAQYNTARDPEFAQYPNSIFAYVDFLPTYSTATQPHMYSQTIEAISNYETLGARSMIGALREGRNQSRLTEIGIPLDNNIPDKLTRKEESALFIDGSLPLNDTEVTPIATLVVPGPTGPVVVEPPEVPPGTPREPPPPRVEVKEPGSLAKSPYGDLVPPNLDLRYIINTVTSSTYSVEQAIEEVVLCNCDCWKDL